MKTRWAYLTSFTIFLITLAPHTTHAAPIEWAISSGGNGHFYELIAISLSWVDARDKALRSFMGDTGHLATITSAAENSFLVANFGSFNAFTWIGASDQAAENDWRWMVGPEAGTQFYNGATGSATAPFNYANWGPLEPNNSGNEDYAAINLGPLSAGNTATGQWGDTSLNPTNVPGFIVEYSNIPEPASAAILVIGSLVLFHHRRVAQIVRTATGP